MSKPFHQADLGGAYGAAPAQNVPNYLVQSILVTVFCCLPIGIVAIVFAAQVNGKLQSGDYAGAVSASKNAKLWCWIAFGIGLVAVVTWLAMFLLGGGIAAFQQGMDQAAQQPL